MILNKYWYMRKNFTVKILGTLLLSVVMMSVLSSCDKIFKNSETKYIPVQLTEGGAWVFVDEKGERVGTQQWENEPTMTMGDLFTARTDSGLSVYRWKRGEAIPIDSLQNLVSVGIYNEGLLPVAAPMQRIKIVDKKGRTKFILEPIEGMEIGYCSAKFSEGLLIVNTIDGKAGVVDTKGKVVVTPQYSQISNFNDGHALAMKYNYDKMEDGPEYFVLDKKGNATKVEGRFGFDEGDCLSVAEFNAGVATVAGVPDTVKWTPNYFQINVDGQVTKLNGYTYVSALANGATITFDYSEDKSSSIWKDKKGEVVMKAAEGQSLTPLEKYVALTSDKSLTVYADDGKELFKLNGANGYYVQWPGGKFGPLVEEYGDFTKNEPPTYTLYSADGLPVSNAKYFGVGTRHTLDLMEFEGDMCGGETVSSAYVDITAAANKLSAMASGSVQGKQNYYIGQAIQDILSGESARYYNSGSKDISIPTNETGQLASGPGFWISGTAKSNTNIVAPTYEHYFDVMYYDYWGTAWGYNRTRQVGVHFNPSAKVESFNLRMGTNHPSGSYLRDAMKRKLKQDGFTLVNSADNYDEYSNGGTHVVVYGNNETRGIGMLVGHDAVGKMSSSQKSELATSL